MALLLTPSRSYSAPLHFAGDKAFNTCSNPHQHPMEHKRFPTHCDFQSKCSYIPQAETYNQKRYLLTTKSLQRLQHLSWNLDELGIGKGVSEAPFLLSCWTDVDVESSKLFEMVSSFDRVSWRRNRELV